MIHDTLTADRSHHEGVVARRTIPIDVVLATRDRPAGAVLAATSILASHYPDFRLCVVDQSVDDATFRALGDLPRDTRMSILTRPAQGLAAARNVGVEQASAPIIAFTDDDCEVAPDWLIALAAAFASDERIGVVFGSVDPCAYDRTAGFVPAYRVARTLTSRGISRKAHVEGLGACMAVRRSVWKALHGFDELLGAGAPLRSAEDSDFAMRVLLRGYSAHETPDATVNHSGFRSWSDGQALIEGYMFGLGAANIKMLRLGGFRALRPLAELAWRWVSREPVVDLNHRPPRLPRLVAFLRGAWQGFRTPLDAVTGRFVMRRP